jgi:hypothetical protein
MEPVHLAMAQRFDPGNGQEWNKTGRHISTNVSSLIRLSLEPSYMYFSISLVSYMYFSSEVVYETPKGAHVAACLLSSRANLNENSDLDCLALYDSTVGRLGPRLDPHDASLLSGKSSS